jgi:hypothetical protein
MKLNNEDIHSINYSIFNATKVEPFRSRSMGCGVDESVHIMPQSNRRDGWGLTIYQNEERPS